MARALGITAAPVRSGHPCYSRTPAGLSRVDRFPSPPEALSAGDGAQISLPTRMNNVPHAREARDFFYNDVARGVQAAVAGGQSRTHIRLTIPETNPEMDVYRVGTVLEMVRNLALSLAQDGARVKVCVQQSMGEGVFQGLPLSLAGVRRIMEVMDWGGFEDFIRFGEVGESEVDDDCGYYLIIAPQNVVGSCIMDYLKQMVEKVEAEGKHIVLINPLLRDVPSSGGVMGVRGRKERMEFADSFVPAYHYRLMYNAGTFFPIKGALRYSYGGPWQAFKRMRYGKKEEGYELCGTFDSQPSDGAVFRTIREKTTSSRTL